MSTIKKSSIDTRVLILNTALKLFSNQGYFNTSVQDIKKAAGVSIGSIYHHFSGKEAIARSLYEDLLMQMKHMLENISHQQNNASDRCKEVIRQLFIMTEYDPDAVRFLLSARHQEFLIYDLSLDVSSPFELIAGVVQCGMDDGEIAGKEALIVSACLFGGPLRMIGLRLDGLIDWPLVDKFDEIWESARRVLAN